MLLIDNREPEHIQALLADDVQVVKLTTGDILDPESGLFIERKTARDFIGSIDDGRLDTQCSRLSTIENLKVRLAGVSINVPIKIPILLIHGTLWPQGKNVLKVKANGELTKWNYWAVMMKIVSIQQSGIIVLIVPQQHLAECVDKLRKWAKKKSHRVVRKPKGIWTKPDPKTEFMALLVGGLKKAKIILKEYGTPGMALAYMHEWSSLKGVGPMAMQRTRVLLGDVPSMVPF